MPELPEVETSCRGIAPYCENKIIKQIIVRNKNLRWPVADNIEKQLLNKKINKVSRRGKYLLLNVSDGALMIHLGMSGSLKVIKSNLSPAKHDHVDIVLSSGKAIRFNDPRRFGSVMFNTEGEQHHLLVKLGVEPLTNDFNADYLIAVCKKRSVAIKQLIMNSHVVVGVGNIYAQEALFHAGVHPERAANKISLKRIERLVTEIKNVLEKAIIAGGSSLKDFTSAEGKSGYFQHTFFVYGKGGEPCPQCSDILKVKSIGQRTTTYCSNCQK